MILLNVVLILLIGILFIMSLSYSNFHILSVTLSVEHAKSNEVLEIVRKEKTFLIFLMVFSLLCLAFSLFFRHSTCFDVLQLIFLFAFILIGIISLQRTYRSLEKIKEEKNWDYSETHKTISLKASREKGKASPSILWLFLIWAFSFLPLLISLVKDGFEADRSLYLLIYPGILILFPIFYPLISKTKTVAIAEDEDLQVAYQRSMEKNNAMAYIASFVATLIYLDYIALASLGYQKQEFFLAASLVFFLALILIFFVKIRFDQKAMEYYVKDHEWKVQSNQSKYRFGLYWDEDDPRLFVPKPNPALGVTLNMSKPFAKVLMAITMGFVFLVMLVGLMMTLKDFDYQITEDSLIIDPLFYGQEVEYENILEISYLEEPIQGERTNGYGGITKGYGYFDVEGIGPALVYIYYQEDEPESILIKTKNEERPYFILNEKTNEETRDLYERLLDQVGL